jgi:hypothetical protein
MNRRAPLGAHLRHVAHARAPPRALPLDKLGAARAPPLARPFGSYLVAAGGSRPACRLHDGYKPSSRRQRSRRPASRARQAQVRAGRPTAIGDIIYLKSISTGASTDAGRQA